LQEDLRPAGCFQVMNKYRCTMKSSSSIPNFIACRTQLLYLPCTSLLLIESERRRPADTNHFSTTKGEAAMEKPVHYIKIAVCIVLLLEILGCAGIAPYGYPNGSNIDPKEGEGRADKGENP
jgi:hypothetical protein